LISIIHFFGQACQKYWMYNTLSGQVFDVHLEQKKSAHLGELIVHFVRMFIGKGGVCFLERYSIVISKSSSLSIQANHWVESHKHDLIFAVPFSDIKYQPAIEELLEEGISSNREAEILSCIVNQVQMHIIEQVSRPA